jgi:hypothetical protein
MNVNTLFSSYVILFKVMAVLWFRQSATSLSPYRTRFALWSVHVGLVMDKVALGLIFLLVLQFSPVNINPLWPSILMYHLGAAEQGYW